MAAKKLREYQFVGAIPDKFKCWQCKELLQEPHVTECCGHHFCQECIDKPIKETSYQRRVRLENLGMTLHPSAFDDAFDTYETQPPPTKKICPSCKIVDFKHLRYLPLKRKISELIVYCPHKANGCEQQLRLGDIEAHASDCDYQSVWCTNKCGEALLKKTLDNHCTNTCLQRIVVCQYCSGKTAFITMHSHNDGCPDFPLACVNKCGKMKIKRKDMYSHKAVCPREFIRCTFVEVGCTKYAYRENLPKHMRENIEAHLSLMMAAHLKLKQEVQRLNAAKQEIQALDTLSPTNRTTSIQAHNYH